MSLIWTPLTTCNLVLPECCCLEGGLLFPAGSRLTAPGVASSSPMIRLLCTSRVRILVQRCVERFMFCNLVTGSEWEVSYLTETTNSQSPPLILEYLLIAGPLLLLCVHMLFASWWWRRCDSKTVSSRSFYLLHLESDSHHEMSLWSRKPA